MNGEIKGHRENKMRKMMATLFFVLSSPFSDGESTSCYVITTLLSDSFQIEPFIPGGTELGSKITTARASDCL